MTQLLNVTAESKICGKCSTIKPIEHFYENRRYKSGYASYCKECHSNYYRYRDPQKRRLEAIKSKYGLSPEEYQALVKAANRTCQTCGTPEGDDKPSKLVVDHCHATGRVRGLICDRCNRALGLVGDNTQTLLNLITYLQNEPLSKTTQS
jgi:hypothetical protein